MDLIDPNRRKLLGAGLAVSVGGITAPFAKAGQPEIPPHQPAGPLLPSAQLANAETAPIDRPATAGSAETVREHITDPGSDFMVEAMRAADIPYVAFMVGSTFRGLQESLINHEPDKNPGLIICVHEEISAAFAHGYFKVTGRSMACMVHSLVGLQHASMAIYNAYCDRVPLLIIAANILDATQRRPGVEWLHTATDVAAFVRDYLKWDDNPVSLQHFAESLIRAQTLSLTPPYAPVLIVADGDLQEGEIANRAALKVPAQVSISPPAVSGEVAKRIGALLTRAEAPVIVADRAARSQEGVDLLQRLAETVQAPVIDLGGRMNMPTTHFLNQTGRSADLLAGADLVLALEVGDLFGVINKLSDLSQRSVRRIVPESAKIVGVSALYGASRGNVQDVQRYFAADILADADAQTSIPALISAANEQLTPERRAQLSQRTPLLQSAYKAMRVADVEAASVGWDSSPISTARLCMELWDQIKGLDWALVSSTVFVSSWPQRLWDITKHHQFIGADGGYGLGYGAPAAAGAALAHRDAGRIPVALTTDGDMLMLPGTYWTLAHHKIPLLTVMHNNRAWHQETMHLQRMTNRRDRGVENWRVGTLIEEPFVDFASVAKGMGVWAEGPITNPANLAGAIKRALKVVRSGRPALLDVVTEPR